MEACLLIKQAHLWGKAHLILFLCVNGLSAQNESKQVWTEKVLLISCVWSLLTIIHLPANIQYTLLISKGTFHVINIGPNLFNHSGLFFMCNICWPKTNIKMYFIMNNQSAEPVFFVTFVLIAFKINQADQQGGPACTSC